MPPFIKQLQSKPELKTPCLPPENGAAPLKAEFWLEAYIIMVQTQIPLFSCLTLHFIILLSVLHNEVKDSVILDRGRDIQDHLT